VELFPSCKAASAIKNIAETVDRWPLPSSPRGHLEFFVERLVQGVSGQQ
jgi:flagellar biosynthesis protein FlhG